MSESNGNGNGVRSALLLFVTVVLPLGGAMASLYVILDQKIDSSRSERGVILDGMRADLADYARRLGSLEQHAAAMKETVREIETQFDWEGEIRALEDTHLRQMYELTHERK
jgi:hypothetical protein